VYVDIYKEGLAHVDACGQGEEDQKPDFFCGCHKWMAS